MAEKINVEIGLDGGAEVTKQLEEIGQAGQKAFGDIQNAASQVDLDSTTQQFDSLGNAGQEAFNKIQRSAQNAATFEQIIQGVKKVEGAFESLGSAATKLASRMTRALGPIGVFARALGPIGIALGVAGGAFLKFGDDAADALNALTVNAAKLGQTPQQLDVLTKALTQAGVGTDAILPGLQKLRESLDKEFFPRDTTTGLVEFIQRLEAMPDSVARTQLAIQTLGDALGGQVIAALQSGATSAEAFAASLGQITPATQQQINDAQKYQAALNQLNAAWTGLKAAFTPITTPIFQFLTEQVNKFREDLQKLRLEIAFAKAVWDVFQAGVSGKDVGEAARKAADDYKKLEATLKATLQAGGQAGQQTGQSFDAAVAAVRRLRDEAGGATTALQGMGEAGEAAGQQTASGMNTATQSTGSFVISLRGVITELNGVTEAAARAIQFAGNLPRPDRIPFVRPDRIGPGMAAGGLLGGRGTGTSDSNLAWVSRGEHIMPARAVAQPGVLGFLEALRRSGGNLRGVLDGLGRFALGGLVPRPAFAAGGSVGSMNNVTINFPGTPPISGLRASAEVVDQLQKAAALAQVRSGGRKPSRYS